MRRTHVGALAVAVGALTIMTACSAADRTQAPSAPEAASESAEDKVVLGHGRDRTASQTMSDWATYADHVIVVTVIGETRHEPSKKEIDRGEGLIGRNVKLRVDKVLWSAPDAPQPAPVVFDAPAAGWVFNNNNGSGTVKFALKHSSRLDKGHTYIKAIEWIDDACSQDPKQGRWDGLGTGDTIPFDGGVLGAGEFEGRVQTADEAKAKWQADAHDALGVRAQVTGKALDTLVASLRATSPRAEKGYGPAECDPSDQ